MPKQFILLCLSLLLFIGLNSSYSQNLNKTKKGLKYKVGDVVTVGYFAYFITNYQFLKSIGTNYSKTADGIFLVIDLRILNTSSETRTIASEMFSVFDSHGLKYEPSNEGSTALLMDGYETLLLKEIHPRIVTQVKLVFEVPSESENYLLQVTGGFWTGKTADIYMIQSEKKEKSYTPTFDYPNISSEVKSTETDDYNDINKSYNNAQLFLIKHPTSRYSDEVKIICESFRLINFEIETFISFADLKYKYGWNEDKKTKLNRSYLQEKIVTDNYYAYGNWFLGNLEFIGGVSVEQLGIKISKGTILCLLK